MTKLQVFLLKLQDFVKRELWGIVQTIEYLTVTNNIALFDTTRI